MISRIFLFLATLCLSAQGQIYLDHSCVTLTNAAVAYQSTGAFVNHGGILPDNMTGAGYYEANYTMIGDANRAVVQDGYIRQVIVRVRSGGPHTWKLKVFRPGTISGYYSFVGESELTTIADTGGVATIQTNTLATPVLAKIGDRIGGYSADVRQYITSGGTSYYLSGDISGGAAFTSSTANSLDIQALGYPPYLAITGDSIPEGHPLYNSVFDGGPADVTGGMQESARNGIGNGFRYWTWWNVVEYQNLAKGSQTWAWVRSTGMPACLAVNPKVIFVACGVNDVSLGRTWDDVLADINAVKATIPAGTTLVVSETLPWTAASDVQAATLRTWNTNLTAWCAANGATLFPCHDAMGQLRVSTGYLDDIKTAYRAATDNVHLNIVGANEWARLLRNLLSPN